MAFPGPTTILKGVRGGLLVVGVSGLAGVLVAGLALPVAAGLGLVARESAHGFSDLPVDLDTSTPLPERSRIVDADGNLLATFYEENRVYRELDDVADVMKEAVLAIEDHRFYEHGPIDFQGTARAFMANLETGEISAGGSTLTQQYAKLLTIAQAESDEERLAATEESYIRKLRELRVAVGLEQELTKDQILEGYVNVAYFGAGAHGVEAAARRYFSTSAADLTLTQAATLAGMVQQPVAYDATRNPELAQSRRDVVLRRMAELDYITDDVLAEALEQDLDLDERERPNGCVGSSSAPFFCEYVYQELMQMDELGETPEERDRTLRRGGLTIQTTLDRDTQRAAREAVSDRVTPTDSAIAGLASVEPGDGAIKAMTHSRGYGSGDGQTYYNYAADAAMGGGNGMQAGSAFKPFVLAAAIEQGISLNTAISSPYQVNLPENSFETCDGPYASTGTWSPRNYSTSLSGSFNLRTGTEQSVNTFYAQLEQRTGLCDPVRIATEAGVTHATGKPLGQRPSFVLGVDEVSPLTMAEAYAMFAARGLHCDSYAVQQIRDRNGDEVYSAEPTCNQVMAEEYADGVNHVLQGVVDNGTGTRMRLADGRPAAGKTGTTNDAIAVWWIGYIPQLATAVAVADPDVDPDTGRLETLNGRTFNGTVFANACGGCIPGPIWKQMMDAVTGDYEVESFVDPDPSTVQGALADVPDVRGQSQADAAGLLAAAGFSYHVADEVSSSVPEGDVVDTQPGPGSRFPSGASVGLVISTGPSPDDEDDDGGDGDDGDDGDDDNGGSGGPGQRDDDSSGEDDSSGNESGAGDETDPDDPAPDESESDE